jgi:23S rRNA (cytidine2498-2'-O)-methyltransferase
LKLYEFFTCSGRWPQEGEECLEIGASPGSWTFVLKSLSQKIVAVDRAPLDPRLKGIRFLKKDAFTLNPEDFPNIKWLFSDVICYPKKLLEWLTPWLEKEINIVCTLKFQGKADYEVIKEFANIENSNLCHLYHNKHELTFSRLILPEQKTTQKAIEASM